MELSEDDSKDDDDDETEETTEECQNNGVRKDVGNAVWVRLPVSSTKIASRDIAWLL